MEIDHLSATIEVEVYPSDDRANDYPDAVVHIALKRGPGGQYSAKFYLSLDELESFMRMLDAARECVARFRLATTISSIERRSEVKERRQRSGPKREGGSGFRPLAPWGLPVPHSP